MFPRLIEVPERTGCYILSEELILHYLPLLFGSYRIASRDACAHYPQRRH